MVTSDDIKNDIATIRLNPTAITAYMIDLVSEIDSRERLVLDANSPFTLALEMAATMGSEAISEAKTIARQIYPILATSQEDLYRHMRDDDYSNRFAQPSEAVFNFRFGEKEFKEIAVAVGDGSYRLVIPRNTRFTAGEIPFTMEYPLEIKLLPHGGTQLSFNTDDVSPLSVIENLTPSWVKLLDNDNVYIDVPIPAKQFQISKYTEAVSSSIGFNKEYELINNFYYARVFYRDPSLGDLEMHVTHSDQIYDPEMPTALVNVLETSVRVTIPPVYLLNQLRNTQLSVYIYTTQGPLNLDLSKYLSNEIKATWEDQYSTVFDDYSAPLEQMRSITVYSNSIVNGGRDPLTFEELRERVTNNSLVANDLPITDDQLKIFMEDKEYSLTKYVDNVTDRIYFASKPIEVIGSDVPEAGAAVVSLTTTIDALRDLDTVYKNDTSVTITPDTLMTIEDNILRPLTNSEIAALQTQSIESMINSGNSNQYLYTPFYYVADTSRNRLDLRAYHLDNPMLLTRNSLRNDSFIEVNSRDLIISKVSEGFKLIFKTRSGDDFRALDDAQIQCQLSFTPSGDVASAYLIGNLMGKDSDGNRIYEFDIDSSFDINVNNEINLTSFKMFNDETQPNVFSDLTTQMRLTFIIFNSDIDDEGAVSLNSLAADFLIPNDVEKFNVVTEELFTVKYGEALQTLWRASRAIVGNVVYQTYSADIPLLYTEDIYELDSDGLPVITNVDGVVSKNLLHPRNSQVLDTNGDPVFKYRKGDYVRDINGDPVPLTASQLTYSLDLHLIDGKYYFANSDRVLDYRGALADSIIGTVSDDLIGIRERMLERTELFYRAQQTTGLINVLTDEDELISINAEQELGITLYVADSIHRDTNLRQEITLTVLETVKSELSKTVVTQSSIIDSLKEILGNDVKGVKVEGLGGDRELSVITLRDNSQRLVLAKRLVATEDNRIDIAESLSVFFAKHGS